jgi:hypothetical protein
VPGWHKSPLKALAADRRAQNSAKPSLVAVGGIADDAFGMGCDAAVDSDVVTSFLRRFLEELAEWKLRAGPRVAWEEHVRWSAAGQSGVARSRDLSTGGALLLVDRDLPVGANLRVSLHLSDAPGEVWCRIVRCSAAAGAWEVAVRFLNLPPQHRQSIEARVQGEDKEVPPGRGVEFDETLARLVRVLCALYEGVVPETLEVPEPLAVLTHWLETMSPRESGHFSATASPPVADRRAWMVAHLHVGFCADQLLGVAQGAPERTHHLGPARDILRAVLASTTPDVVARLRHGQDPRLVTLVLRAFRSAVALCKLMGGDSEAHEIQRSLLRAQKELRRAARADTAPHPPTQGTRIDRRLVWVGAALALVVGVVALWPRGHAPGPLPQVAELSQHLESGYLSQGTPTVFVGELNAQSWDNLTELQRHAALKDLKAKLELRGIGHAYISLSGGPAMQIP